MCRAATICLLLISLLHCGRRTESITEASLSARLEEFNQAFADADTSRLSLMVTEDYSHINGTSRPYSKQEWLGYVASQATKIDQGALKIDRYSMDEINISLHSGSAVVTGIVTTQGSENDTPFHKQFRVTHFWVYKDNQWQRAAFHDGRM